MENTSFNAVKWNGYPLLPSPMQCKAILLTYDPNIIGLSYILQGCNISGYIVHYAGQTVTFDLNFRSCNTKQ